MKMLLAAPAAVVLVHVFSAPCANALRVRMDSFLAAAKVRAADVKLRRPRSNRVPSQLDYEKEKERARKTMVGHYDAIRAEFGDRSRLPPWFNEQHYGWSGSLDYDASTQTWTAVFDDAEDAERHYGCSRCALVERDVEQVASPWEIAWDLKITYTTAENPYLVHSFELQPRAD